MMRIVGALAILLLMTSACGAPAPAITAPPIVPASPIATRSLIEQAAVEATAIMQRAEATAIVARAQATAAALVAAAQPTLSPTSTPVPVPAVERATPIGLASPAPTPLPATPVATEIRILGVGFGAQGNYIHVQFVAPVNVAKNWQQGVVAVTDEATGTIFQEVPVMPVIGPLFSRPVRDGQGGYFMLVHNPRILQPGSKVTVKLGSFVQEHIVMGQ